jgi:hypothetical protein
MYDLLAIQVVEVAGKKNGEPEFGSLQSPGGRKMNADHLVNFRFAPREHAHSYGTSPPKNSGNKSKGRDQNKRKYSKQSFLQAKYGHIHCLKIGFHVFITTLL